MAALPEPIIEPIPAPKPARRGLLLYFAFGFFLPPAVYVVLGLLAAWVDA